MVHLTNYAINKSNPNFEDGLQASCDPREFAGKPNRRKTRILMMRKMVTKEVGRPRPQHPTFHSIMGNC